MTTPMIVAGTTQPERIFCQFWGEWKASKDDIRTVEYAQMATDTGLRIAGDCPTEWLPTIWAAYLDMIAGRIPTGTHTIHYDHHSQRTFRVIGGDGGL